MADDIDTTRAAAARLAKTLKRTKDDFPVGTVIRWLSAGTYNYAAIKAGNGAWYTTGGRGYYGTTTFWFEDLVKVLGKAEVTDVSVATEWTSI